MRKLIYALSITSALAASSSFAQTTNPIVEFDTTAGNFQVQLNPQAAPTTVANILQYVKSGFYNNTIFHRVIPGFMVQGGGFTPDMTEKPTKAAIISEANNGLHNIIGTIAMARTEDPNSATAQFFINTTNNPSLDYSSSNPGYTVFGKVISGMATITKISAAPTTTVGPYADVPVKNIVINNAFVVKMPQKTA